MTPRHLLILAALAIAVALPLSAYPASPGPHSEQGEEMIQLDITGAVGTRFRGTLTIRESGETQRQQLEGTVPARHTLRGQGLDLELTQTSEGHLSVELRKGGNRSISRVAGTGSRIRLSAQ